jgi:ATP/ADP translocase
MDICILGDSDRRGNFILAIQLTALISAQTFLWTHEHIIRRTGRQFNAKITLLVALASAATFFYTNE